MNAAVWGALSAASFGSADFIARFTGRGVGPAQALLVVLVVGAIPTTAYALWTVEAHVWPRDGFWLLAAYAAGLTLATLLLYQGLSRGPVTVVAPIVAAHPALVVALAVVLGARPGPLQWLGMGVTLAGALVVARCAEEDRSEGRGRLPATLAIAGAACVVYAGMVSAGQAAAPIYGEVTTIWVGRLAAVALLAPVVLPRRARSPQRVPALWWPVLGVQGLLDAGGHLFLLTGSHGARPEVAAVTSSTFGVITTLLAYAILRERVTAGQWGGIALVFAGVAALAIVTPA